MRPSTFHPRCRRTSGRSRGAPRRTRKGPAGDGGAFGASARRRRRRRGVDRQRVLHGDARIAVL
ncbi:hypothetical protein DDF65_15705 [Caulobacter radicis]|uniref:Uncharacterized protein n=1 Tax=Caulobacter radicis TaxID=2172650 RepID=A0A2T9J9G0_9CAUL|nr:hypothetical protein DDF65_15705 [Caulobacter radicis]